MKYYNIMQSRNVFKGCYNLITCTSHIQDQWAQSVLWIHQNECMISLSYYIVVETGDWFLFNFLGSWLCAHTLLHCWILVCLARRTLGVTQYKLCNGLTVSKLHSKILHFSSAELPICNHMLSHSPISCASRSKERRSVCTTKCHATFCSRGTERHLVSFSIAQKAW